MLPPEYKWIAVQPSGQVLAFNYRPEWQLDDAFGPVDYPCLKRCPQAIEIAPSRILETKKPFTAVLYELI